MNRIEMLIMNLKTVFENIDPGMNIDCIITKKNTVLGFLAIFLKLDQNFRGFMIHALQINAIVLICNMPIFQEFLFVWFIRGCSGFLIAPAQMVFGL